MSRQRKIDRIGLEAVRKEERLRKRAQRGSKTKTPPSEEIKNMKRLLIEAGRTESTAKNYIANVSRIFKQITGATFNGSAIQLKEFDDVKKTVNFIQNLNKSQSTKNNLINSITSILKLFPAKATQYQAYSKINTAQALAVINKRKLNATTPAQEARLLKWLTIVSKLDDIKNIEERAIYGLFTLINPRRSGTHRIIKIGGFNNTDNILKMDGKTPDSLILNDYKTSDQYGQFIFKLPRKLKMILKFYIISKGKSTGDYLFTAPQGGLYQPSAFSKLITDTFEKYTGKRLTTTLLRISFASHFFTLPISNTEARVEAEARANGHSVKQFRLYKKNLGSTII